jgi:hypothetical protein
MTTDDDLTPPGYVSLPGKHYWWLSFVSRTDDNAVACHLGIAIVICHGDLGEAIDEAWEYDCNPGGEVLGLRMVELPMHSVPRHLTYRLMTDPGEIGEAQIILNAIKEENQK